MDKAYFVSKTDILAWVNQVTQANVTKIEQLGTGAIHCQLIDAYYDKVVPMNKVNWKAREDFQFIQNLKIMQKALGDLNYKKKIEIEKLAKAKYQDNLEFIQWLKKILEGKTLREGYDPIARRGGEELFYLSEKEKKLLERPAKEVPKEEPPKKVELPRKPPIPTFGKKPDHKEEVKHEKKEEKKDEKKEEKKDEKKADHQKSKKDLDVHQKPKTAKKPEPHKADDKKHPKDKAHDKDKNEKSINSSKSSAKPEDYNQLKEDLQSMKDLLAMDMDPASLVSQLRDYFNITVNSGEGQPEHVLPDQAHEEKKEEHHAEKKEDHPIVHEQKAEPVVAPEYKAEPPKVEPAPQV